MVKINGVLLIIFSLSLLILTGCSDDNIMGNAVLKQAYCGDKICNGAENRLTCLKDCTICGDTVCEGNENSKTCTADCSDTKEKIKDNVCGDGKCSDDENCDNCLDDCDCDIGLENYPDMFSGKPLLIVIGAKAPSLDVVAATELTTRMNRLVYSSALDNEVSTLKDTNAIVIGTPCDNKWAKELLPYEKDCVENGEEGQSLIKMFKTGKESYALLIFGYTPQLTRSAANRLATEKLAGTKKILE